MKLLIVIPYYEPAWAYGGPPRLVSIIARELAKRHTVTVLTTDVLDARQRIRPLQETLGGVAVHRFPTLSNSLAWKTKIIIPKGFRTTVADHVHNNDFIFLSDFRHWLNAVIAPQLWRQHKPYSLATFGQIQKPSDLKYPLKVLFDQLWGKKLVQRANVLIAQTEHEAKDYYTLGGQRKQIHLMPLMENTPTADELAQREVFRKKYELSPDTKLLLFVGRINKLKGIDVLLHSFAQVRKQSPQLKVKMIIVGRDDGYQNQMRALIKQLSLTDAVIQTGPLYGSDNAACYLAADYFVFTPTYYEETSLAAVRALSFGLPVLTTPQAELPWLDDYQAGFTVPNQVTAIVSKLTEVLPNAILRTQFSTNALRLFSDHYEQSCVLTDLEHVFKTTLQRLSQ